MPAQRFFIGAYNKDSGQQTNVKPWIIPDEAFAELNNAYVFRGRVRKRFGSTLLNNDPLKSRFRINIATTDGSGNTPAATYVPRSAGSPIATPAIGQMFSVGDQVFTVWQLGATKAMLISGTATVATFDTNTGEVVIKGADANATVYYYPALPVMGLKNVQTSLVDDNFIVGFDTRFAYQYSNGWERLDQFDSVATEAFWTGNNSQFFWATTWSGSNASDRLFFVTNFNENEPKFMRYLIYSSSKWKTFKPAVDGTNFLLSARIIVPFKNRLVALNTWEGTTGPGVNYVNRARYSQVGSPVDANSWNSDIPGRGNAIDAATTESIVTVEFIKDRLIVYFDQSTWELVYTGNQAYPFTWQQINTELGAEATFSVVPFDKYALAIGNVGVHSCNGSNVQRIDDNIPDEVFAIHNGDNGPARVYGIRDYFVEMVYWTFPSDDANRDSNFPYPNRVLVYNYRNQSWAFNDDSITAFGYYQPADGVSWDSTTVTWNDPVSWGSGSLQAKFRSVIAGNQEGFTFICNPDVVTNAPALQITNIVSGSTVSLTIVDHNLRLGDYIYIQGAIYDDASDGLNNQIFQVTFITDKDNFEIGYPASITGNYVGGGLVSRVSKISITTKEYNFFAESGRNAYVSKVDFMVDATPAGEIQVNFFVSTSTAPLLQDGANTGALLGTGILETFPYTLANGVAAPIPFEEFATRLWHPVYFQADGEIVQLQLVLNDDQMKDVDIRDSDFQMHAMCIYAEPTSSRFQ